MCVCASGGDAERDDTNTGDDCAEGDECDECEE